MNLTLTDVDSPLSALRVSAASSNTALLPTANATLAGSGATRTLTATTVFLQSGAVVVSVTVSDGQASTTTAITVRAGGFGNDTLTGGIGPDRFSDGPGTDVATDFNPLCGDTSTR